MGLALHNPSDSDYLCNLTEHRHLPGRRENPKQRHPRRPFHWSRDKLSKIDFCYEQEYCEAQARFSCDGILQDAGILDPGDWESLTLESKQHHLAALAFQASRGRRNKYRGLGNLDAGLQHRSCPRPNWMADEKEGRALARSSDPLPSDRARERRPPSLERQEAFRDPNTSTSRKRAFSGMSELLEQEELYRLGVLYDDEHERGAGFTLGTILHDQPLFNMRQAKRGRGRKGKRADDELPSFAPHLPLHLSFSALGEDEALAAFLISPDVTELVPEMEETTVITPAPRAAERRAASQPALTTIYEVEIEYSADFLTQPDTQHSLDFDSAPASSDFPDMVSDSDNDNESDYDDEKEDGEDAWALLDRLDDDDDTREGAGGRNGDGSNLPASNADAWVVLGDDS